MSAIDPFRKLIEEWDAGVEASRDTEEDIRALLAENADLKARLAALESGPVTPPGEPPSKPAVVPFTEPPLKQNPGSWTQSDYERGHSISNGKLSVWLKQEKQTAERIVRHDFGFQDPKQAPGHGGFLREPANRLRRYEIKVQVPDDYLVTAKCNLFQFHTHSSGRPPYVSFLLWNGESRWRHDTPGGARFDHNQAPIKRGHAYSLAVEALWSQGMDGRLRLWEDGKIVLEFSGPNYALNEDQAPYLILGPYFPSVKEAFKATFVFSDLKVGDM